MFSVWFDTIRPDQLTDYEHLAWEKICHINQLKDLLFTLYNIVTNPESESVIELRYNMKVTIFQNLISQNVIIALLIVIIVIITSNYWWLVQFIIVTLLIVAAAAGMNQQEAHSETHNDVTID